MTRVDEIISVSVAETGEPTEFNWRNCSYRVGSKPTRWFARREWWVESARAQRGIGAGLLEVEMWRFQAVAKEGLALQVELIHSTIGDSWRLVRIFEQ
mgnify:FL=1